ncbi:BTB/POZ and TAZ domain-containing protein 4-like isoform X2 [Apium graveolens]|uniref:BTB/POZ and TAZ domain-containing protein 4-like isoform X2 n=1 Tax=Apium graveolens TaxID=4045 RepID=UPI003D78DC02
MGNSENFTLKLKAKKDIPVPPPLCGRLTTSYHSNRQALDVECVPAAMSGIWDRLFDEAYRADVLINTDNGNIVYAHASILGVASSVFKNMLRLSKCRSHQRSISIRGVPHDAVRVFIRFLYSNCYEVDELEEHVLHLLVLSHTFVIPRLKRVCERRLENGFLSIENVVDIFQLALLCDAPRLSLICHRFILKSFKAVSATEGWQVMKQSHPVLERELMVSMIYEDTIQKERTKWLKDRKIYLELYEAMEALVHICKDGCRTIGPSNKGFKKDQPPCKYEACKGLESLFRHFSKCNLRVSGGCIQCKRMGQLLELHSRLCADSDMCRVPLCRTLKYRTTKLNKKEDIKWRILVKKISRTKSISGAPFFSLATTQGR